MPLDDTHSLRHSTLGAAHSPSSRNPTPRSALWPCAVLLALLTSACEARTPDALRPDANRPRAEKQSAAAAVSNEDVRRLSPARKAAMPDIIVQAADRSRQMGNERARVHLYVISDYQCAECRAWFSTVLPALRRSYLDSGTVTLTWLHYPLRAHPNAVRAASAALCAGSQGNDMFWAASERLFAEQARWSAAADPASLVDSLVTSVGVEPFALRSCTESGRLLRQIRADIDWIDASDAGAPLLVLVGTRPVGGGAPLSTLRPVLDSALAAAR